LFMRNSAMSGRGVSVQFHVVSSRGIFYRPSKVLAPQGEIHDLPQTCGLHLFSVQQSSGQAKASAAAELKR
jgi:hypothetical protein